MKRRPIILVLIALIMVILNSSCEKQFDYSADVIQLKKDVLELQKRTDSLSAALALINSNNSAINRKIDSLRVQINSIVIQITQINVQITQINGSSSNLNDLIAELNKQLALLTAQLNYLYSQFNISSNSLNDGLVAWYPFSGNAFDSSGYGNNGIINNASFSTGKKLVLNTAANFNGSSYVTLPSPFLDGKQVSSFTMHTRVYFNSLSNSPNIWGKTFFWGEVNLLVLSTGQIQLVWANSVTGNKYSEILSATGVIQTEKWYDLSVVFQNSNGKVYINGLEVSKSLKWVAQGGSTLSTTRIEEFCNFAQHDDSSRFGVRRTGGIWGNYLNGKIDDFRLYNRVLTDSEISFLSNL